jgi:hypothetical protein
MCWGRGGGILCLPQFACSVVSLLIVTWGTRWRSWLRHCATSRKVAGSIPNGVIEFFH